MASSLYKSDVVQIVTALLGHAHVTKNRGCRTQNVRLLDEIFTEVVHDIRGRLSSSTDFEYGAKLVSRLVDDLFDHNTDTSLRHPTMLLETRRAAVLSADTRVHEQLEGRHSQSNPDSAVVRDGDHSATSPPFDRSPLTQQPIANSSSSRILHSQVQTTLKSQQLNRRRLASTRLTYSVDGDGDEDFLSTPNGAFEQARPPKKKRYPNASPSTHCHVCCRLVASIPVAVCSNTRKGTCRKVVCQRCMREHGWDWSAASRERSTWVCPHCDNQCGTVRAHCWVYKRTNQRRKINGMKNRLLKLNTQTLPDLGPASSLHLRRPGDQKHLAREVQPDGSFRCESDMHYSTVSPSGALRSGQVSHSLTIEKVRTEPTLTHPVNTSDPGLFPSLETVTSKAPLTSSTAPMYSSLQRFGLDHCRGHAQVNKTVAVCEQGNVNQGQGLQDIGLHRRIPAQSLGNGTSDYSQDELQARGEWKQFVAHGVKQ